MHKVVFTKRLTSDMKVYGLMVGGLNSEKLANHFGKKKKKGFCL